MYFLLFVIGVLLKYLSVEFGVDELPRGDDLCFFGSSYYFLLFLDVLVEEVQLTHKEILIVYDAELINSGSIGIHL